MRAPAGIDWIQPDEMTVCCGAGTPVDELAAALAEHRPDASRCRRAAPSAARWRSVAAACAGSGDGPVRDVLLQARYVAAAGEVVKAGGPTVKNVSGFDLCRLLVGSRGTLGFLGDVILRTRPIAAALAVVHRRRPTIRRACSLGCTGRCRCCGTARTVWVLLEGHPADVAEQAERMRPRRPVDGPPALPPQPARRRPGEQLAIGRTLAPGSFVAEVGVGVVHLADRRRCASRAPRSPASAALQRADQARVRSRRVG